MENLKKNEISKVFGGKKDDKFIIWATKKQGETKTQQMLYWNVDVSYEDQLRYNKHLESFYHELCKLLPEYEIITGTVREKNSEEIDF
jgi:hypothetical protein